MKYCLDNNKKKEPYDEHEKFMGTISVFKASYFEESNFEGKQKKISDWRFIVDKNLSFYIHIDFYVNDSTYWILRVMEQRSSIETGQNIGYAKYITPYKLCKYLSKPDRRKVLFNLDLFA